MPATQCDVDHIVPVTDDSETSQFNGRLECRPHNRDATLHDHDGVPLPQRDVTILDQIRAELRWRHHHEYPEDSADDDDGDEPAA